jgi:hypothetical protein
MHIMIPRAAYLTFQPYYLIECRHVAVLSSIIQSLVVGAFQNTLIVRSPFVDSRPLEMFS